MDNVMKLQLNFLKRVPLGAEYNIHKVSEL